MNVILKFFGNFEKIDEKKVFWTAFWIAVCVMVLHILFFHNIERDSAYFYTALVREFGVGRYEYAFFPIIPPLLTILAGSLVKIGLPAFGAVKTVSAFFFIAGLFPLRSLMRRIVGNKLAAWACIVYVCSSYLIRNTVYGYPFALKMFFLVLSTYLVIKFAETLKLKFAAYLGLSLGALALSRGECIGFFPFFLMWLVLLPLYFSFKNERFKKVSFVLKRQVLGILFIFIFFFIICSPQIVYVYNRSGVPLTELRTAEIAKSKIEQISSLMKYKIKKSPVNRMILEKNSSGKNSSVVVRPVEDSYDVMSFERSLKEAYKGLYLILIIFAVSGLFKKVISKKFSVFDLLYFSVIFYNALMFLVTVEVTRRYTAVTQPFELGWVALGGWYIYSWEKWEIMPKAVKKYWKILTGFAMVVILTILLLNGFNRFTESIFDGNQYLTAGKWIKHNKELFPSRKFIKINNYHTNRLPVIASALPTYGYWAEGDWVPGLSSDFIYPYANIVEFMNKHNATVFIYDDRMQKMCPTFLNNYKKDFVKLKEFKRWGVTVFRKKDLSTM
jgi:hypothetical protein